MFSQRIQKLDSDGNFVTKWGSKGSGDRQFLYADDVVVDPYGYVYISDRHNNRIQKFDSNGNFITKWGSLGSDDGQFNGQFGVDVDLYGNIYVVDSGITVSKYLLQPDDV